MSVHDTIIAEMKRIAVEQKKTLGALDEDAALMTCGLDSLGFAVLVVRLEEQLGTDPFSEADDVALPVTIGELVRFYERALV